MSEPLRLTLSDQAMIHALGALSRPSIMVSDRGDLELVAGILRDVLPGVSRGNVRLSGLIATAEQIATRRPERPGFYGDLHDHARKAMNEWDRRRLADAWDRIRGVSA